jgi:1-acyl-sn-glycerol-3-phosphate acyltransferase
VKSGESLRWRFGRVLLTPGVKLVLKLKVQGRENLPPGGPLIIACSHTCHADPILVAFASGRETYFLARKEIFEVSKSFAWLIRTYHALPVSRGMGDVAAFRQCSEWLSLNRTLVLFPEGTRSKGGRLQVLHPGVAMLAIMNHVPVVPAFIAGARRSFLPWLVDPDIVRYNQRHQPGSMKFRIASLWDSRITVRFGQPLPPDGFDRSKPDYLRFTTLLSDSLHELEEKSEVRSPKSERSHFALRRSHFP